MMVDADLADQRARPAGACLTRALITGVTGQDGGYLAERLLAEGAQVHGLVLTSERHAAGRRPTPRVRLHEGDLADAAGRELVDQVAPDEIYNLAGSARSPLSWETHC